jgi:cytochrome P450
MRKKKKEAQAVEPAPAPRANRVLVRQILIHAGFHHRDSHVLGATADRFSPDSLTDAFPPVYVFSRHRQSCAGQFLARFLIKAALAALLSRFRFALVAPGIDPGRIPHLCDHFGIELRALDGP